MTKKESIVDAINKIKKRLDVLENTTSPFIKNPINIYAQDRSHRRLGSPYLSFSSSSKSLSANSLKGKIVEILEIDDESIIVQEIKN